MQYIKDFLAKDPKKANLLTLTFTLLHKFDFIKSLDKVTIIKYYERKHKQRATNWIGEAYQVIGVVETEVRRTEAYFEERQAEIKKLTDSYIVLFNDLKALAVRERDRIGNFNGWQNDRFLAALWEVAFNGNRNLSTSQIIALADTLHIQLQDGIFSDVKHVLYEPTLKFNLNGRFLIGQMQTLNQLYMNHLKGVTAQFTEAYRFLYLGEFNYLGENKLNKKD